MTEIGTRQPVVEEREAFEKAVRTKNIEALHLTVYILYPKILWGTVVNGLSPSDRLWVLETLQQLERETPTDSASVLVMQ